MACLILSASQAIFRGCERWLSSYEHILFLRRTENPRAAPSTEFRQLTTTCYSSCRESDALLFWPLQACTHVHKPIFTHAHKHQTANTTVATCWSLSPKGPSESLCGQPCCSEGAVNKQRSNRRTLACEGDSVANRWNTVPGACRCDGQVCLCMSAGSWPRAETTFQKGGPPIPALSRTGPGAKDSSPVY